MLATALYPAMTLALLALAIFLPAELSQWNDRRLLDEPHITRQSAAREGFAESMQLSIGEKLLMIRSGNASVLRLEESKVAVSFAVTDGSVTVYSLQEDEKVSVSLETEVSYESKEEAERWTRRLAQIQGELATLYQLGALPQLWSSAETAEFSSGGQVLYMDSDTQVSFQVYYATLSRDPYTMHVAVDEQSGRILAFTLSWPVGTEVELVWGLRGMSNFGEGWRDYWGLDSVDRRWNSKYVRSILAQQEELLLTNGSYTSNADVAFSYDSQAIYIPLGASAVWGRTCQLSWNSRMESFAVSSSNLLVLPK